MSDEPVEQVEDDSKFLQQLSDDSIVYLRAHETGLLNHTRYGLIKQHSRADRIISNGNGNGNFLGPFAVLQINSEYANDLNVDFYVRWLFVQGRRKKGWQQWKGDPVTITMDHIMEAWLFGRDMAALGMMNDLLHLLDYYVQLACLKEQASIAGCYLENHIGLGPPNLYSYLSWVLLQSVCRSCTTKEQVDTITYLPETKRYLGLLLNIAKMFIHSSMGEREEIEDPQTQALESYKYLTNPRQKLEHKIFSEESMKLFQGLLGMTNQELMDMDRQPHANSHVKLIIHAAAVATDKNATWKKYHATAMRDLE